MDHSLTGRDIVIFATARWEGTNRVNAHHLALQLSRHNRVLFVESTGLRRIGPQDAGIMVRRLLSKARPRAVLPEGLSVLGPLVPPTRHRHGPAARLAKRLLQREVLARIRGLGFQRPLLWSLHPFGGWLAEKPVWGGVVYHCVDDYAEAPGVCRDCILAAESDLVSRADVVLATAAGLLEGRYRVAVAHMPNHAVDTDQFDPERVLPLPVEMEGLPRPIIGYAGNLAAYKVDLDLVADVARTNPQWSFVFVGPVGHGQPDTRLGDLARMSNVHLLGPRPFEALPAHLAGFDVAWIPFRAAPINATCLPMKFFEYLAMGLPVVATDLPALRVYEGIYRVADDASATATAIRAALEEGPGPAARRARSEMGRAHSWPAHVAAMSAAVADALDRRAATGARA